MYVAFYYQCCRLFLVLYKLQGSRDFQDHADGVGRADEFKVVGAESTSCHMALETPGSSSRLLATSVVSGTLNLKQFCARDGDIVFLLNF